ncbi:MAG: hypothetical protein LJE60_12200 [Thiocapsa sp.]|jgi:hypothetical protein|nr:hypothetical protein [Thiocapsa sp.]MCG6897851.1 hypothetical protein [Thiocapsa sp.]
MDTVIGRRGLVRVSGHALALALLALVGCGPVAETTVSCAELSDPDLTRVVMTVDTAVSELYVVTPEFLWADPDQPETRRFDAGTSDVSPNLADRPGVRVEALRGRDGAVRVVDFAALEPGALELEGLRGSLVMHETYRGDRALASFFYTASGHPAHIVPLQCRCFRD